LRVADAVHPIAKKLDAVRINLEQHSEPESLMFFSFPPPAAGSLSILMSHFHLFFLLLDSLRQTANRFVVVKEQPQE
jgi:hypothetical protein